MQVQSLNAPFSYFLDFTGALPGNIYSEQKSTCIGLHKCVNQVIIDFLPQAAANLNTLINDVLPKLLVSTDKQILSTVLGRLINTILNHSHNNNIHISAKLIGNITLIHVRSSNAAYSDAIANEMQNIELQAEAIGGCLTISNNNKNGLTLAFTFTNH